MWCSKAAYPEVQENIHLVSVEYALRTRWIGTQCFTCLEHVVFKITQKHICYYFLGYFSEFIWVLIEACGIKEHTFIRIALTWVRRMLGTGLGRWGWSPQRAFQLDRTFRPARFVVNMGRPQEHTICFYWIFFFDLV